MEYNNRLSMRDLFMNADLADIFPQIELSSSQSAPTYAETEARVLQYLITAFNGTVAGRSELLVRDKHKNILRRLNEIRPLIEGLFSAMPTIARNVRSNTKIYTPFATLEELKDAKSYTKKIAALRVVLGNLNYNPDFDDLNSMPSGSRLSYQKRQEDWKKKVGYKE